ncbi:GbsR/MarR family transcriptional regulator [Arthrobacter sp. GMC3]|uniref:GbsR/MarR family transcriptional regulator n=1 Tax=Arthrobacter sp. GMC3 TaxID=2058894 RepID=UPI000CE4B906|nr:transcriptional regulator [Arthrobacter sp. GMC3]
MTQYVETENTTEVVNTEADRQRRAFAEEFGLLWESRGFPPMDGRVVGYLLIMDEPYISSGKLAADLGASPSSVSLATRRMLDVGYIRRHIVSGDRSHYFRLASDPWGGTLDQSLAYFGRMQALMDRGTALVEPQNGETRQQLRLGHAHMVWLAETHRRWTEEWETYKKEQGLSND